jgi:hypothetical protein
MYQSKINRRGFLGTVGAAATGAALAGLIPCLITYQSWLRRVCPHPSVCRRAIISLMEDRWGGQPARSSSTDTTRPYPQPSAAM